MRHTDGCRNEYVITPAQRSLRGSVQPLKYQQALEVNAMLLRAATDVGGTFTDLVF